MEIVCMQSEINSRSTEGDRCRSRNKQTKLGAPIKETNGIKHKNIEKVGTEPKLETVNQGGERKYRKQGVTGLRWNKHKETIASETEIKTKGALRGDWRVWSICKVIHKGTEAQ